MPITPEELIERLAASGLMPADKAWQEYDAVMAKCPTRETAPVAQALIDRELLTEYQAEVLCLPTPHPLRLGNYLVLDRLGQGSMGLVCSALDLDSGGLVAIKMLGVSAGMSKTVLARFQREAQAASLLKHPNIVAAIDSGAAGDVHYMAMELVDGWNLEHHVRMHGRASMAEAVQYITAAARGLHHAHQQDIVHRDVKPANIMLTRQGAVKIADMGLALFKNSSMSTSRTTAIRLTQQGQVLGTADFMAPEQAHDTMTADHRADIYSLGCTWYFLLTGAPVYLGETLAATLLRHASAPVPSLVDVTEDTANAVWNVVFRRMLAKSPADRFQSMADVVAALQNCQKHVNNIMSLEPGQLPAPLPLSLVRGKMNPSRGGSSGSSRGGSSGSSLPRSSAAGSARADANPPQASAPQPHAPQPSDTPKPPGAASPQGQQSGDSANEAQEHAQRDTTLMKQLASGVSRAKLTADYQVAEWVLSLGGSVVVNVQKNGRDAGRLSIQPRSPLPAEAFRLETIRLEDNAFANDADLGNLVQLKRLTQLFVGGMNLTDAGAATIAEITSLQELSLARTRVTAGCLPLLGRLTSLQQLNLAGVVLSDQAVGDIARLRGLQKLVVSSTGISENGIVALQSALPLCEVIF